MKLNESFGLTVAYIVPGFIVLLGTSPLLPIFAEILASSDGEATGTVGGFLYTTLAALSLGLLVSAVRWLLIDSLHARTGLSAPARDFSRLSDEHVLAAFEAAVENHYRYYQYYANAFLAVLIVAGANLVGADPWRSVWLWLTLLLVEVALFLGGRDALRKYYERSKAILGG